MQELNFNKETSDEIIKIATDPETLKILRSKNKGYVKFPVEKKNGGLRWIHAPNYRVKAAQQKVLQLLPSPRVTQYSHDVITGFIPGLSILDNARPHVGKQVILSIDLKNFFPSFTRNELNSLFSRLPDECQVRYCGNLLELITTTKGRLPQGAPTSPMLANWLCVEGDKTLVEFCTEHKLAYTRYADDLTFSSITDIDQDVVEELIRLINSGLFGKKVKVAPKKIKFMRRHKQQRVTGIVVNEKLSIPRARRKQLRAFMHDAETNGIKTALSRFNKSRNHIFGELSFLHLAHEDQAIKYIQQLKLLL